jgi:hypothetical protein
MRTNKASRANKKKSRLSWLLALCGSLILIPTPATCQIVRQLLPNEVSLDYTYLRSISSGTGGSFNTNGASASAAWNLKPQLSFWKIKPRLSLVADLGGYRFGSQYQGVDGRLTTYTAGPRMTLFKEAGQWTPFGQLLLGGGRVSGSTSGLTAAENGFVLIVGGGLTSRFRSYMDIRVIEVNYMMTRFVRVTGTPGTQNDIRASAGVVLHFGRK